jgi:hypothetical protein
MRERGRNSGVARQWHAETMEDPTEMRTSVAGQVAGDPTLMTTQRQSGIVPIPLVWALSRLLDAEGILCCHWKSNNAMDRSASGDNDLDLLVARADATRFQAILLRLGFKQAEAPTDSRIPGVMDYFGYDSRADKIVHVHAHFRLVFGHDMTKNVRLPIEEAYLASSVSGGIFRIPLPEFEYIVLVLRLVLKHATWDAILGGERRLRAAEKRELGYLEERSDPDHTMHLLRQHLPWIGVGLFRDCTHALGPGVSLWAAARTGRQLQARLAACSRRPPTRATFLKLQRRCTGAVRRRLGGVPRYRLQTGGTVIALVGGDGAGKSTAINGLRSWLGGVFATTTLHMGKPPWSLTTWTVRSVLKVGQLLRLYALETGMQETLAQRSPVSPGFPWLIREVCLARDRHRLYRKAQRLAANGALVLLDRLPLPRIRLMDAARTRDFVRQLGAREQSPQHLQPTGTSRWVLRLVELEERYYQRIVPPDLTVVLRVDPQVAVRRKTEDNSAWVVERATEIWDLNWEDSGVHVVNANRIREEVLAELKGLAWTNL